MSKSRKNVIAIADDDISIRQTTQVMAHSIYGRMKINVSEMLLLALDAIHNGHSIGDCISQKVQHAQNSMELKFF